MPLIQLAASRTIFCRTSLCHAVLYREDVIRKSSHEVRPTLRKCLLFQFFVSDVIHRNAVFSEHVYTSLVVSDHGSRRLLEMNRQRNARLTCRVLGRLARTRRALASLRTRRVSPENMRRARWTRWRELSARLTSRELQWSPCCVASLVSLAEPTNAN